MSELPQGMLRGQSQSEKKADELEETTYMTPLVEPA